MVLNTYRKDTPPILEFGKLNNLKINNYERTRTTSEFPNASNQSVTSRK
jgi:hypothetical protein